MKYILIALLFVYSNRSDSSAFRVSDNEIKLEAYHKAKSTFSGELDNLNSIHLIIAKNTITKEFDILPSIFNFKEQKLKQLKPVSFSAIPSIISFHNNNDVTSLITSIKIGKNYFIRVIDINIVSGEIEISEDISKENMKTSIRRKNNTLLVFSSKEKLKIIDIKNSNSIKSINVIPSQETKPILKSISKVGIDAIRYDEFTENGSIKKNRLYATDSEVIITSKSVDDNETKVIQIPLNKEFEFKISPKTIMNNTNGLTKKTTSFVINNKVYQFKINKDRAEVLAFDLNGNQISEIELTESNIYNKAIKFKNLETFLKKANRGNNEPTITLNRTKSNNFLVRLDYVSINSYNYYNDWFFRFQQNQFLNQQQFNVPTRFGGPSPQYYDDIAFNTTQIINQDYHFDIVIDSNDNILKEAQEELVYKDIDKQKYDEIINNSYNYKYTSGIVIGDQFRYFVYHKDSKSFRVFKKNLDD